MLSLHTFIIDCRTEKLLLPYHTYPIFKSDKYNLKPFYYAPQYIFKKNAAYNNNGTVLTLLFVAMPVIKISGFLWGVSFFRNIGSVRYLLFTFYILKARGTCDISRNVVKSVPTYTTKHWGTK